MKLKLIEKRPETPLGDCISFIFQPEQPVQWIAGQFFTYQIENPSPDDRGNKRFFTCAAAPFEQNIRITTRFAPEKGSSFKNLLHSMEIGQTIEANGPNGHFTLEDLEKESVFTSEGRKLCFIAGGIGITPFRAILLDLDHNQKPMPITLLYGNRDQNIVFKDLFDDLAKKHADLKIEYVLEPTRIDKVYLEQNMPNFKEKIFYVSGPEPMVEGVKKTLLEMGLPEDQIKTDYFPGYTE